jgi:hypothetical protein
MATASAKLPMHAAGQADETLAACRIALAWKVLSRIAGKAACCRYFRIFGNSRKVEARKERYFRWSRFVNVG